MRRTRTNDYRRALTEERAYDYDTAALRIDKYLKVSRLAKRRSEAHEALVTVDHDGRAKVEDVLPGESCERVLEYMNYDRTEILDSINKQLRRVTNRPVKKDEVQRIYKEFEAMFPRYTYLER